MVDINFLKKTLNWLTKMKFELSGSDLRHLIDSIGNSPNQSIKPIERKLLSESDACKLFGLTRQTFHALRKKGKITFHVLGSRIYYIESELIANMETINKRPQNF